MIIMAYSTYDAASIDGSLGAPEYSYWFVRRAFWPMLERFGIVVPVTDPAREVDTIQRTADARGVACVFFGFEPPHKIVLGLRCTTVPVFAWEFDTIPDEVWEDDPRHDWTSVLKATGLAITHSRFSVDVVKRRMGQDFPIWSIPAPVYDAHAHHVATACGWQAPAILPITGIALDSRQLDLAPFSMQRAHEDGIASLRALAALVEQPDRLAKDLHVSGVIYTAIFNPIDGRKNWTDLLVGFVWAFRDEPNAILVMKVTHYDPVRGLMPLLSDLAKLGSFRCRVILIHGMLPDMEYQALIRLTSYTINASTNEGQCLPLMEFMSAGRPAISPLHTAMLDYISPENAFLVDTFAHPASWPHDPREAVRTVRHTTRFPSLVRAYQESFRVARDDAARYAAMSQAATNALAAFCSNELVAGRLAEVFGHLAMATPQHAAGAAAAGIGESIDTTNTTSISRSAADVA